MLHADVSPDLLVQFGVIQKHPDYYDQPGMDASGSGADSGLDTPNSIQHMHKCCSDLVKCVQHMRVAILILFLMLACCLGWCAYKVK